MEVKRLVEAWLQGENDNGNKPVPAKKEAGRAGRVGEETVPEIVVEEKDWPADDTATDRFVEPKGREVNSLIRTQGCRRRVLGQCLDGDPRDCRGINAVLCDNCQRDELKWKSELSSQGLIMSREYTKRAARGMEQLLSALEEIEELGGKLGCRICWMFEGAKKARYQWYTCESTDECLSFLSCMDFQGKINYRRDPQARFLSCFYSQGGMEARRQLYLRKLEEERKEPALS
ncbi:hypothetical protein VB005_02462 [Metarhizium brunneum]